MIARRMVWWTLGLAALSGCAGVSQATRVASAQETMCKHCNCLMPAGIDHEATCPVCHCHRKAHQCVRGR